MLDKNTQHQLFQQSNFRRFSKYSVEFRALLISSPLSLSVLIIFPRSDIRIAKQQITCKVLEHFLTEEYNHFLTVYLFWAVEIDHSLRSVFEDIIRLNLYCKQDLISKYNSGIDELSLEKES